jgi:hypothetical protein
MDLDYQEKHSRIGLEDILLEIGDEVGKKYSWFLMLVEAAAHDLDNKKIWGDELWTHICETCNKKGYYEIEWDFFKRIASNIYLIEGFVFSCCEDKEMFLIEAQKTRRRWEFPNCELRFEIDDGRIEEISGTDATLVEKLKKTFSPLPILLR